MRLVIKNMVCARCIMVVSSILKKHSLTVIKIELGEVNLEEESVSENQLVAINNDLMEVGFELIDDKKRRVIEKIKNLIVELVHNSQDHLKVNLSEYLTQEIKYDYNYLSNLFSEVESTTIEKYYITQKIEKVKELSE